MVVLIDSELLGALMTVDCGEHKGRFQGLLDDIEGRQAITLKKCFRDGHQVAGGSYRILLNDVRSVRVLAPAETGSSTIRTEECPNNVTSEIEHKSSIDIMAALGLSQPKSQNGVAQNAQKNGSALLRYAVEAPKSVQKAKSTSSKKFSASYAGAPSDPPPEPKMTRIDVNSLLTLPSSPTSSECITQTENSPSTEKGKTQFQYQEFGSFKKFGKQVPSPLVLENRRAPRNRHVGPTGIPQMDCSNGYNGSGKGGRGLQKPLDREKLNTDFDFEANLQLFRREDLDDAEYEIKEKPNESDNYAHDENIITDPARVFSWVNRQGGISFIPTDVLITDQVQLPVLSKDDKENCLKEAEAYLGRSVFSALKADRVLLFLLQVIERYKESVQKIVILATESTDHEMIQVLVRHIRNRRILPYLFGASNEKIDGAFMMKQVREIPIDAEVIVSFDGAHNARALEPYMQRTANGPKAAHVVSVDGYGTTYSRQHSLLIGMPSEDEKKQMQSRRLAGSLVAVCDVGIPFHWMSSTEHSNNLADAFARRVLAFL